MVGPKVSSGVVAHNRLPTCRAMLMLHFQLNACQDIPMLHCFGSSVQADKPRQAQTLVHEMQVISIYQARVLDFFLSLPEESKSQREGSED